VKHTSTFDRAVPFVLHAAQAFFGSRPRGSFRTSRGFGVEPYSTTWFLSYFTWHQVKHTSTFDRAVPFVLHAAQAFFGSRPRGSFRTSRGFGVEPYSTTWFLSYFTWHQVKHTSTFDRAVPFVLHAAQAFFGSRPRGSFRTSRGFGVEPYSTTWFLSYFTWHQVKHTSTFDRAVPFVLHAAQAFFGSRPRGSFRTSRGFGVEPYSTTWFLSYFTWHQVKHTSTFDRAVPFVLHAAQAFFGSRPRGSFRTSRGFGVEPYSTTWFLSYFTWHQVKHTSTFDRAVPFVLHAAQAFFGSRPRGSFRTSRGFGVEPYSTTWFLSYFTWHQVKHTSTFDRAVPFVLHAAQAFFGSRPRGSFRTSRGFGVEPYSTTWFLSYFTWHQVKHTSTFDRAVPFVLHAAQAFFGSRPRGSFRTSRGFGVEPYSTTWFLSYFTWHQVKHTSTFDRAVPFVLHAAQAFFGSRPRGSFRTSRGFGVEPYSTTWFLSYFTWHQVKHTSTFDRAVPFVLHAAQAFFGSRPRGSFRTSRGFGVEPYSTTWFLSYFTWHQVKHTSTFDRAVPFVLHAAQAFFGSRPRGSFRTSRGFGVEPYSTTWFLSYFTWHQVKHTSTFDRAVPFVLHAAQAFFG
ncbi:uncharacterized protein LOC142792126, partial [Rhipicephalus microplus]|uniref:uncharacterized protein LOC142792126 n=1 Tax=Rhipicephalus microplus TaxID=6941 RepID=UPI003F6C6403